MTPIRQYLFLALLALAWGVLLVVGLGMGALPISLGQIWEILFDGGIGQSLEGYSEAQYAVLWQIRMPRVLAASLVGAALAFAGAALQGIFRNPLADPGIIGISAGGSLAASIALVIGLPAGFWAQFGLSGITFLGALATVMGVWWMARTQGGTGSGTLILAGIAINAFAGAGTGMMTFLSSESQLRSLTFWLMGSLGGATWTSVGVLVLCVSIPALFLRGLGKQLNAFALGEQNAATMGVRVQALKVKVLILSTLAVGGAVALSGIIGFVALVIPHMLRMAGGHDHRFLLPASMILGAGVLLLADILARTVVAPQELPIGLVTALLGTPFFLIVLNRQKKMWGASI